MVEIMTKTQLLGILFGDAGGGGFYGAQRAADDGLVGFEGPVWKDIASGVYWTGIGQADAATVAQRNTLALDITRTEMEVGAKVVESAVIAFSSLATGFEKLNEYAKTRGFWITESGTVIFDKKNPNYIEGSENAYEVFRKNIEFAAKNILKTATLADVSTAASLDKIREAVPSVGVTVDPGALAHNQDVLDQVLVDRDTILSVAESWSVLDDAGFLGVEDVKAANIDDLEDLLGVKGITLNEDLEIAIKALEQTPAGDVLEWLQKDVPDLIGEGIQWGLERTAERAGFGSLVELVKTQYAKFAGIAGWATFAGDVAIYLAGKLAPDGIPNTQQIVDNNGDVKATVYDQRLYELGHQFYYADTPDDGGVVEHQGSGSLADLAHQQRLGGAAEGEPNYVADAEALRANLKSWLDGHAGDGASDPDVAYARSLVEELNRALGDDVAP